MSLTGQTGTYWYISEDLSQTGAYWIIVQCVDGSDGTTGYSQYLTGQRDIMDIVSE